MDLSTIGDHDIANDAVLMLALKKDGAWLLCMQLSFLRNLVISRPPHTHTFLERRLIAHDCFVTLSLTGSDTYEKIDVEKFSPPGDEAK